MRTSYSFPDRESWLAVRNETIGASDVAAICGCNPYKSAYTLWAEKLGKIEPTEAGIPARVGLALENLVTELYEERTQRKTHDPGQYTVFPHPEYPWWGCTPDRLVLIDDIAISSRAVELKTIGENAARNMRDGDPPLAYQVQLQAQLAILGCEHGDLACLIGNRDFEVFEYERHERLIRGITEKVLAFRECLLSGNPPAIDDSISTARTLAALHPDDNGETVLLSESAKCALERLDEIKREMKRLEADERLAKNMIIAEIGDATFGNADGVTVSYKTQERAGYIKASGESKAAMDAAGIEYTETQPTKFRVLRMPKGSK